VYESGKIGVSPLEIENKKHPIHKPSSEGITPAETAGDRRGEARKTGIYLLKNILGPQKRKRRTIRRLPRFIGVSQDK